MKGKCDVSFLSHKDKMADKYVFIDWSNVDPGYGVVWPDSKTPSYFPQGICLKVHKPVIQNISVLVPDKSWESGCVNMYATFLRDGDVIKAWYECFKKTTSDDMQSHLAYAKSYDGVNFVKPNVGLVEFEGDTHNNLVANIHGSSVFIDELCDKSERYKLIWAEYETGLSGSVIKGAVSADGINWTNKEGYLLKNRADTQNILDYDENKKRYVIYTRQPFEYPVQRRAIWMSHSKTFSNFSKPEPVLHNDPVDPPDWDLYTSGYNKWPGADNAHIMLCDIYKRAKDIFEVHLFTSRDGLVWYRPGGNKAYIGKDTPGFEQDMIVSSTKGIIDNGDGTWSFYVYSSVNGHNTHPDEKAVPYGSYKKAIIREDGFMSASADDYGSFYTARVNVAKDSLCINASIEKEGYIKASLVNGKTLVAYEGFSADMCDCIDNGKTWNIVTWNGLSDISRFKGYDLKIRFDMYKCSLFAFKL